MTNSRLLTNGASKMKRLSVALFIGVITFHSSASADTDYGPIRPGETLSSIVNENYLVSPFPDLMIMREIFKSNPGAFINNNMGLLKQGVTLTLPSDTTIARSLPAVRSAAQNSQLLAPQSTVATPVRSNSVSQDNQRIKSLEERLASVRAERDRANSRLRKLEAETVDLTARVAELESSNERLNDEIKAADEALKVARAELANVQSRSQPKDSDTTVAASQSATLIERDLRIKTLEASIAALHDSQAEELTALQASLDSKIKEQATLEGRVESLTKSVSDYETQISELKKKNESLVVELAESRTAYDQLLSGQTMSGSEASDNGPAEQAGDASADSSKPATTGAADQSFDISNLNAQNISNQLDKPVTFPLWGLLLGLLALALTSVMMLFARSRAKKSAVVDSTILMQEPIVEESVEDVVFRSADPERVEPDIEALRVPPRRDPSRVAILDPTMNEQSFVADDGAESSDINEISDYQTQESELKLAMAEAYGELGDLQAANELLVEVQVEGSQQQSASAQILLNRLAG